MQPYSVLLILLVLTLNINYKVIAEPICRSELLRIRSITEAKVLKDIWSTKHKPAVKAVDPAILKSKKRGKRAGVKVRLRQQSGNIPLPGLILKNAQSITPKLDELFALVNDKKTANLTQLICITESWLTPNIPPSQTALDGYAQFRNDRSAVETGKSKGGGLLVYVDEGWSKNNETLSVHTDSSLELLTLKCRPKWLPREFQSIIVIACYCPYTGSARLVKTARETSKTILNHISDMEHKFPEFSHHDVG